ncbi:MAG: HGxxPAAW family protein [bacterium]|nr:HGxxPAAW family protein [bacterium]
MIEETYIAPRAAAPVNHGRTVASWTLVWIVVAGVVIAGIGFAIPHMPVLIAGLVILLAGIVAGLVMRGLGMGQPIEKRTRRDWYQD